MVEIFALSGIINALTAISFGFLVAGKNIRERSNQIFLLMTLSLTVWGVAYWYWLSSTEKESALLGAQFLALGSIFIPVFFYHWVIVLFQKKEPVQRFILIAAYSFAIFAGIFTFSDFVIVDIGPRSIFPFWPTPGIFYTLYIVGIYTFLVLLASLILLQEYFDFSKKSNRRGQIIFILLGVILGFGGGITNFPLWYGVEILPYGTFLVATFPFLLGYSALRHRLFSLKTIATEILVFFISVVLLIQVALSNSFLEQVLRTLFLFVVGGFGILLVRSVYREVEQRQQIEKLATDLRVANEKLKELDKLKSQFLSIASHDLRAPLTAIRNFMALLIDGTYGKLPPAAEEGAQHVFDRATAMASSVDDYLNVSRIEQGRMTYDFEPGDLKEVVLDAVGTFKLNINEKGLKLIVTIPDGESFPVSLDKVKIQEVFNNLLDNAIKYTPEGSITIKLQKDKATVCYIQEDTGIGMDEKTQKNLFGLFTPGEDSKKINPKSTGVGLYITKAHVEGHKGKIKAESDGKGAGSRFIVELPLDT